MLEAGTIQTSESTDPAPSLGYRSVSQGSGMLKNPAIVETVQNAESAYGPDFYMKLNDPTGKYIGATVKPIDPSAKVRAQAVMDQTEPGKAFNEAMGKGDGGKGLDFAKDASSAASGVADRLFTATQNVTQNQRQADLIKWKEDGKYWFDPNSDLKPDLDTYLSQMPSATDALVQGSPIAKLGLNKNAAGNTASSVLINPSGFKVKNQAVSNILNPTNLADRKMGEGFANYVGSKAAQGAMSSGLGPQMIVGGIVGMFEGIFGWTEAKDEDTRNKKAATEEYKKALRDWTVNRNKRLIAEKQEKYAEQQAALDRSETLQKTKGAEKALNIAARRKQIATVLANTGSISKSNRDQRLARWR